MRLLRKIKDKTKIDKTKHDSFKKQLKIKPIAEKPNNIVRTCTSNNQREQLKKSVGNKSNMRDTEKIKPKTEKRGIK